MSAIRRQRSSEGGPPHTHLLDVLQSIGQHPALCVAEVTRVRGSSTSRRTRCARFFTSLTPD